MRWGRTNVDLLGRLRLALAERYAVERVLGQGGTAVVCLAQDLRHSRPVAIKVLRPEIAAIIGADRFLHEIETVARLQHPHILPLYDSGEADGLLYFVMPYVQGDTLRDLLEREKLLPVDDAVAIGRDIAAALAFAHERGVIHRDIKPENVLLFGGAAVVADFGIARVLSVAGDSRSTETGLALGTPLYMSPEQAAASGDIDARSDIYSLACVVYEMLAGTPPFTGISPSDVLAHHLHRHPRPINELRSTVPSALALAVAKALAKLPADRFRTVAEFADAMRQPSGEHAPARLVPTVMRRVALGALAASAVALAAVVIVGRLVSSEPLVRNRLAVLPLQEIGAAPAGLSGDQVAMMLRESLARWRDVSVVTGVQVSDAWGRGRGGTGLRGALGIARQLGAGRLVWGQQTVVGDSVRVEAALYDVRRGSVVRSASLILRLSAGATGHGIDILAQTLVADSLPGHLATGPLGTSSVEAWNAYAAGHSALAVWKLPQAVERFGAAAAIDPGFAQAQFWQAQLLTWSNAPREQWEGPARAAAANSSRLRTWRDSAYVAGLLALVERRYPEACERYRAVLGRDSTDVIALVGLGDCLARDRVVIRDAASPSGWRFRSSLHSAIGAYRRALGLAPSVNFLLGSEAYERLVSLFYVEFGQLRTGRPLPPDTGTFAAFPSLQHDSIAFVPYPFERVRTSPRPTTIAEAVDRNRSAMRDVIERWVASYPNSGAARNALAKLLELEGNLGQDAGSVRTAFGEVRASRRLAGRAPARLEYGADQVRILVKLGRYDAARELADSLLRDTAGVTRRGLGLLSGVAALVGHVEPASTLWALSLADTSGYAFGPIDERLPLPLTAAALGFATRAALGAQAETLQAQVAAVERLMARHVAPARRVEVWHTLMDVPMTLAFPAVRSPPGYGPRAGTPFAEVRADLTAGHQERATQRLMAVIAGNRGSRPGELAISAVLQESRLLLLAGDTADAQRHLLATLVDLEVAPTLLIDEPVQAGSLVAAMRMAAELAAAKGDVSGARRWAGAVASLWQNADPPLRAVADRMRAM